MTKRPPHRTPSPEEPAALLQRVFTKLEELGLDWLGELALPQKPGLGLAFDREAVKRLRAG